MIENHREYQNSLQTLADVQNTIRAQSAFFQEQGYTEKQLERALASLQVFEADLQWQIESYEAALRGTPFDHTH